jgi:hypothetical protein
MTVDQQKAAFLEAFAQCGVISLAADASGTSANTVQRWKQKDEQFIEAFNEALERCVDQAEMECYRRGVFGHERPAVSGGKLVKYDNGEIVKLVDRSDRMLELYLKGRRRRVFGDKHLEIAGDPDRPLQVQMMGFDVGS